MFKIALIGTVSLVLLLAAGTIASAKGIGTTQDRYGYMQVGSQVGRMAAANTTATHISGTTMASHMANIVGQMRTRASQMQTANQMSPATNMDPGYTTQPGNMGTGTGYMDPGTTNNMGTTSSGTGMGTTTTHAGSGSMMGR
jgi:hypothetical protein